MNPTLNEINNNNNIISNFQAGSVNDNLLESTIAGMMIRPTKTIEDHSWLKSLDCLVSGSVCAHIQCTEKKTSFPKPSLQLSVHSLSVCREERVVRMTTNGSQLEHSISSEVIVTNLQPRRGWTIRKLVCPL